MHNKLNCPQCGGDLPIYFKYSRLIVCKHCESTLLLEDNVLNYAGYQSVISEEPSIIQFQKSFTYNQNIYLPIGKIRYRYDYGFWDEWWVLNTQGEGAWLSVDEGDYAFELRFYCSDKIPEWRHLSLNQTLIIQKKKWRVTELGQAICEGFLGELPEPQNKGERFKYAILSNELGGIVTIEYLASGNVCYMGKWIDHYEIAS